ncbi:hypothetical protein D516_2067 [Rhodobacter sp. AKP1]|nr:hypothetical protein D516_2067 [Rhodobacter sp. AKP1]
MNSLVVLSFGPGRWSPPSGRAQGHAQRQLRRRSARAATARRGVAELIAMVRSRVMARILRSRAQKESAKVTGHGAFSSGQGLRFCGRPEVRRGAKGRTGSRGPLVSGLRPTQGCQGVFACAGRSRLRLTHRNTARGGRA